MSCKFGLVNVHSYLFIRNYFHCNFMKIRAVKALIFFNVLTQCINFFNALINA